MEAREFNRLLKEIGWNKKAIEKIYHFYYAKAVKHFNLKYGREIAEDATQDFFLHLLKIGNKQDYINNPTGWIYTCIENIIKRKIQTESHYYVLQEVVATAGTVDSIENEIYTDQLLKELKPLEQKIIYLIYWEGYSRKEVADILHLTAVNVRQICSRAIKKLKKLL